MPAFWDDRNGHLVTRPKQLPDVYPQLAEDWVGSETDGHPANNELVVPPPTDTLEDVRRRTPELAPDPFARAIENIE